MGVHQEEGAERAPTRVEPLGRAPQAEEHLLEDLLTVLGDAGDPAGHAEDRHRVAPVQLLERTGLPLAHGRDEVGVGPGIGVHMGGSLPDPVADGSDVGCGPGAAAMARQPTARRSPWQGERMERRRLGTLGEVSVLSLGGGGLGQVWGPTDREEAVATVHAAVDAGDRPARPRAGVRAGRVERVVADAYARPRARACASRPR